MTPGIYMDNQATTRVDPRVMEAMRPFFDSEYGNPASRSHAFGWRAEEAVTRARTRIARLIHADPKEILFTSGATESNNLALFGALEALKDRGDHVISAATEHLAVLDPLEELERRGWRVTILPVDRHGRVAAEDVRRALTDRTVLVSLMAANNEIGTLHPIGAVGALCKERGVLFHTDAAQAVGKIPLDVQALNVDLLSVSGHKVYGPKGIGALYVRRKNPRVILKPTIHGGGHERGLRSGTLNVPGIVGLGAALEIAGMEMAAEAARLSGLRDRLQRGVMESVDDVVLNGHPAERLPHNLNLSFADVEGEAFMTALDGVAISSGSACTSARQAPSHVLRALGVGDEMAVASIRFSLGRFNTEAEVDEVIRRVISAVSRLRAISPLSTSRRQETRGGSGR